MVTVTTSKDNRILKACNSDARKILYNRLMGDIKNFSYLEQRDIVFVLRIVVHKIQESKDGDK